MCDAIVRFLEAITAINWLEVIKALASVAVAIIAFAALKNWQKQDKAKRKADFLDELINVTHTFIAEMSKPITIMEISKIGMTSYAPTCENGEPPDIEVKGAIAYIEKHGEGEVKRLLKVLELVQSLVIRLRSLAAKGQVFKFDGYVKCLNAVAMLTWHFDRIEGFVVVIGSPTLNWKNPKVLKQLKDMMAIDPDEIRNSIHKNNVALLEFASDAYQRIYG